MSRLACLVAFLSLVLPQTTQARTFLRTRLLMGDVAVSITVESPSWKKESVYRAMDQAFEEALRVENAVSEWRPDSDATRLNRNAGKALVPIGKDLQTILMKAAEISEATDGAFDVTFASKKKNATYRDVVVLPELGLAYLRPGVTIGVSGIAKGAIVDRMSDVLKKAGFKKFLVDAGDLYASGSWEIGIRDPHAENGPPLCRLTVKDRAVSTSGLYERGPHIVDPRTGKTPRRFAGVTVIGPETMLTDALATAFLVLGNGDAERMKRAAAAFRGVSVVAVTPQGERVTAGAVSAGAVSGCR